MIEYLVSGKAEVISDQHLRREQTESIAASPVVTDNYYLFEFQVENVLVVEYDEERKPVVRRWSSGKSQIKR